MWLCYIPVCPIFKETYINEQKLSIQLAAGTRPEKASPTVQLQIAKMVPNRPQNLPICGKGPVYHSPHQQLRLTEI